MYNRDRDPYAFVLPKVYMGSVSEVALAIARQGACIVNFAEGNVPSEKNVFFSVGEGETVISVLEVLAGEVGMTVEIVNGFVIAFR